MDLNDFLKAKFSKKALPKDVELKQKEMDEEMEMQILEIKKHKEEREKIGKKEKKIEIKIEKIEEEKKKMEKKIESVTIRKTEHMDDTILVKIGEILDRIKPIDLLKEIVELENLTSFSALIDKLTDLDVGKLFNEQLTFFDLLYLKELYENGVLYENFELMVLNSLAKVLKDTILSETMTTLAITQRGIKPSCFVGYLIDQARYYKSYYKSQDASYMISGSKLVLTKEDVFSVTNAENIKNSMLLKISKAEKEEDERLHEEKILNIQQRNKMMAEMSLQTYKLSSLVDTFDQLKFEKEKEKQKTFEKILQLQKTLIAMKEMFWMTFQQMGEEEIKEFKESWQLTYDNIITLIDDMNLLEEKPIEYCDYETIKNWFNREPPSIFSRQCDQNESIQEVIKETINREVLKFGEDPRDDIKITDTIPLVDITTEPVFIKESKQTEKLRKAHFTLNDRRLKDYSKLEDNELIFLGLAKNAEECRILRNNLNSRTSSFDDLLSYYEYFQYEVLGKTIYSEKEILTYINSSTKLVELPEYEYITNIGLVKFVGGSLYLYGKIIPVHSRSFVLLLNFLIRHGKKIENFTKINGELVPTNLTIDLKEIEFFIQTELSNMVWETEPLRKGGILKGFDDISLEKVHESDKGVELIEKFDVILKDSEYEAFKSFHISSKLKPLSMSKEIRIREAFNKLKLIIPEISYSQFVTNLKLNKKENRNLPNVHVFSLIFNRIVELNSVPEDAFDIDSNGNMFVFKKNDSRDFYLGNIEEENPILLESIVRRITPFIPDKVSVDQVKEMIKHEFSSIVIPSFISDPYFNVDHKYNPADIPVYGINLNGNLSKLSLVIPIYRTLFLENPKDVIPIRLNKNSKLTEASLYHYLRTKEHILANEIFVNIKLYVKIRDVSWDKIKSLVENYNFVYYTKNQVEVKEKKLYLNKIFSFKSLKTEDDFLAANASDDLICYEIVENPFYYRDSNDSKEVHCLAYEKNYLTSIEIRKGKLTSGSLLELSKFENLNYEFKLIMHEYNLPIPDSYNTWKNLIISSCSPYNRNCVERLAKEIFNHKSYKYWQEIKDFFLGKSDELTGILQNLHRFFFARRAELTNRNPNRFKFLQGPDKYNYNFDDKLSYFCTLKYSATQFPILEIKMKGYTVIKQLLDEVEPLQSEVVLIKTHNSNNWFYSVKDKSLILSNQFVSPKLDFQVVDVKEISSLPVNKVYKHSTITLSPSRLPIQLKTFGVKLCPLDEKDLFASSLRSCRIFFTKEGYKVEIGFENEPLVKIDPIELKPVREDGWLGDNLQVKSDELKARIRVNQENVNFNYELDLSKNQFSVFHDFVQSFFSEISFLRDEVTGEHTLSFKDNPRDLIFFSNLGVEIKTSRSFFYGLQRYSKIKYLYYHLFFFTSDGFWMSKFFYDYIKSALDPDVFNKFILECRILSSLSIINYDNLSKSDQILKSYKADSDMNPIDFYVQISQEASYFYLKTIFDTKYVYTNETYDMFLPGGDDKMKNDENQYEEFENGKLPEEEYEYKVKEKRKEEKDKKSVFEKLFEVEENSTLEEIIEDEWIYETTNTEKEVLKYFNYEEEKEKDKSTEVGNIESQEEENIDDIYDEIGEEIDQERIFNDILNLNGDLFDN